MGGGGSIGPSAYYSPSTQYSTVHIYKYFYFANTGGRGGGSRLSSFSPLLVKFFIFADILLYQHLFKVLPSPGGYHLLHLLFQHFLCDIVTTFVVFLKICTVWCSDFDFICLKVQITPPVKAVIDIVKKLLNCPNIQYVRNWFSL
jgi:hypothetical protein